MAKPRVYELAKVLNVDSKTVLEKLKDMGEFVKSASAGSPASEGRVRQGQRQGRFQARAAAPPGRTFGPGFHFIFRTDSGRSRTSGIACLGTSAGSDSGCTDTASAGRRTPRHADPRSPRSERQP